MARRPCAIYAVGIICASLLVVGIGLIVGQVFRTFMLNRLKKEIVLVEGSRVFGSWKSPPPPVYMEYFFFNFTNMDAFLEGAKPEVQQVGPYTYRYKDNVTMLEDDKMVSAYNYKSFVFLREKSVGDPAVDNITTVNIPAWAVMNKVKGSFWKSSMVAIWMNSVGSGLFTTRTVDELLWGYEDPLLARVSTSSPEVEKVFGLMSIHMEFEKDVEVKGIPAYRFTPPRSVFASKEENPANEGFCVSPKECLGTGLLKVSPCRKGAPVVASFPHFYLGENKYAAAIGGLSPKREHHQTFLDLNPTTGVIVRANKRAQVNILINRISGFP
ncbi:Lysosome membrane protein 2 [Liparis tanakae]|uniref:Lysosome membrane protein 2 n=1 Tax=Liparis tanakae TaxID=230148 RepID=A0A4Z2GQ11_9TELE|nr:Lysosome membrane protein 2 [Liparis tanakae]